MKNIILMIQRNNKYSTNAIKPVVIYKDADKDKLSIFVDNRGKIGIYRWTNLTNGNIYVGSSINISVRMYTYYSLKSLVKSNRPIDRALLKYGFSSFSLDILEYCSKENVLDREQYYIDALNPSYNIAKQAGSTLGYKHTSESISKMRDFVLSDELKAAKSLATRNASRANQIPLIIIDTLCNKGHKFDSLTDASKFLSVSKMAISLAISENRLLKKRYKISKDV